MKALMCDCTRYSGNVFCTFLAKPREFACLDRISLCFSTSNTSTSNNGKLNKHGSTMSFGPCQLILYSSVISTITLVSSQPFSDLNRNEISTFTTKCEMILLWWSFVYWDQRYFLSGSVWGVRKMKPFSCPLMLHLANCNAATAIIICISDVLCYDAVSLSVCLSGWMTVCLSENIHFHMISQKGYKTINLTLSI